MTTVVAINSSNDIYKDNTNNLAMHFGDKSTTAGIAAIFDACQTASLAQLREMVLFTTQGMPAKQNIFNANPNLAVYQAALIAAIQRIPGVISVRSIVFTKTENVLHYVAKIESQYGELTING